MLRDCALLAPHLLVKWLGLTIFTLAHLDAVGLGGVHFIALRTLFGQPKFFHEDRESLIGTQRIDPISPV